MKCEPECVIDINNTNLTVDFALMLRIIWILIDRDGINDSTINDGDSPVSSDTNQRGKRGWHSSLVILLFVKQTCQTTSSISKSCFPTRPYLKWKME